MAKDRVYIVPTYYGFVYGGGIIVCVLAAASYGNNLAYLLCFFLVALFVIGMHQSNANLKKLKLEKIELDISHRALTTIVVKSIIEDCKRPPHGGLFVEMKIITQHWKISHSRSIDNIYRGKLNNLI